MSEVNHWSNREVITLLSRDGTAIIVTRPQSVPGLRGKLATLAEACGVLPHWPGAATGAATAWVVRLSASGWEAVLERCNGTTWVDHRGRAWKLRNIPMAFRFDNKEHAESAAVLAALSLKHGG